MIRVTQVLLAQTTYDSEIEIVIMNEPYRNLDSDVRAERPFACEFAKLYNIS